jgi:hypothetical protein
MQINHLVKRGTGFEVLRQFPVIFEEHVPQEISRVVWVEDLSYSEELRKRNRARSVFYLSPPSRGQFWNIKLFCDRLGHLGLVKSQLKTTFSQLGRYVVFLRGVS